MGSHGGGHDGIDEDTLVKQVSGDVERLVVVADEERDDGCGGISYLAAHRAEIVEGVMRDFPQVLLAFRLGEHDVEGGVDGGRGCRSDAGREDVGARMVTKVVGYRFVGGDEAAEGGERLAEGAHYEVNVISDAEMVARAASPFAEDSYAVGLVYHH